SVINQPPAILDQQPEFARQWIVWGPRMQFVPVQADHLQQQSGINRIALCPTGSEGLPAAGQGMGSEWVKNDDLSVHERVKQSAALLLQGDRSGLALESLSEFCNPLADRVGLMIKPEGLELVRTGLLQANVVLLVSPIDADVGRKFG